MSNDKKSEMIDDCVSAARCSNHPFNDWELEFIESIAEQFKEKKFLSPKQVDTLERIWEKI